MAEQLTSAVAVLHQQAVCAEVVADTLEEIVCAAAEYSLVVAEVCEAAEEVASLAAAECEAAEDSLAEVDSLAAEEDAGRRYSLEFRV